MINDEVILGKIVFEFPYVESTANILCPTLMLNLKKLKNI